MLGSCLSLPTRRVTVEGRSLPWATIGFASGCVGRVLRLAASGDGSAMAASVSAARAESSVVALAVEVVEMADVLRLPCSESEGEVDAVRMSCSVEVLRLVAACLLCALSLRCENDRERPLAGGSKNIPNGRPSGLCMMTPEAPETDLPVVERAKYSEADVDTTSAGVEALRMTTSAGRNGGEMTDGGTSLRGERAFCGVGSACSMSTESKNPS